MNIIKFYLIYLCNFVIAAIVFGTLDFLLNKDVTSVPILMIVALLTMNSMEYGKK